MEQTGNPGHGVRGKQRQAVYAALEHPATGRRLLESARKAAPSMTYQDLRHILRDFQESGLAVCLNPECQTGRFYAWATFEGNLSQTPKQMSLCAKVGRAKTRLAVLAELARDRFSDSRPLTATHIRRLMRQEHPLGLNHVLAALKFLEGHGLAEIAGHSDKRGLKIYRITALGRDILALCGE